jgi:hypothetical protein
LYASGAAMQKAMKINMKNSFENNVIIFDYETPNTFLMPISLVF